MLSINIIKDCNSNFITYCLKSLNLCDLFDQTKLIFGGDLCLRAQVLRIAIQQ